MPLDKAQFPKYYSEKDGSRPCIYVLNKEELPMLSGFKSQNVLLNKLPAV